MIEALKGGICDLGENKVQEMIPKMEEVRQGSFATPQGRTPVFHLIGHLQTNKARHVVAAGTDLIHSVDSLDLAKELDKRTRAAGRVQQILLQVSISGEETKSGINPAELPGLVEEILRILPGLHIRGLMTMAPLESEPEATRPVFAGLRQVRDDLRSRFYGCERIDPVHLSMGMTNDWRQAVSEGATLIRIGSALFGPRPSASP
jgi:pyridoxal phosphate enzyme (YggS family)